MNAYSDYLVFVFSTALILLTPGPTNTLLMGAGAERGRTGTLPLIGAELGGYLIAISTWGVFLMSAPQDHPWVITLVRAGASTYLACMAVKVWRRARVQQGIGHKVVGPKTLFTATLLNPKGLLFASTCFPAHAFEDAEVYTAAIAGFICLLVPIGMFWVRCGVMLSSGRLSFIDPVKLQRAIALTIGVFSISIAWVAFR